MPTSFCVNRFGSKILCDLAEHFCIPRIATNTPIGGDGSSQVLGVSANLSMPGMSVTPAVLSQTLCQRLFSRLTERYWQHWASVLMQRTDMVWTEYTLYYLIAEHDGLIEKFHVTLPLLAVRDYFAPVMYGGKLISNVGTLIFALTRQRRGSSPSCRAIQRFRRAKSDAN